MNRKRKNRKEEILSVAQEIFSAYGLVGANISDIAKEANVVDSNIYHYFKNKEDLLFWALADKMSEAERELKHHLQGIVDPLSRLGKVIWFHLWLNDESPDELRLIKHLLFECRGIRGFYHHEGFGALKSYMKITYTILQQGVNEKVFRSDVNLLLFRNMIFGMLDEESLRSFVSNETERTLPDFTKIMDYVQAMILRVDHSDKKKIGNGKVKKETIYKSAEQIFAEKGYNSATMGDIATAAGISEGSIYTHFKSKEDLLFFLPAERFKWFKRNMVDAFDDNRNPLNELSWFMRLFYRTFLSNMNFLKVFLFSVKLNRRFYASSGYLTYLSYISEIEDILDEGKRTGFVRKEVDSRVFRNFFLGAFFHLTTRWMLSEKTEMIEVMQQWDEVISLLIRSVAREKVEFIVG